jgi:hypothetical protein
MKISKKPLTCRLRKLILLFLGFLIMLFGKLVEQFIGTGK